MIESTSQVPCQPRGAFERILLETQASRIDDPIEKLRYLRQSSTALPRPRRKHQVAIWAIAPVLLAGVALSVVPVSNTAPRPASRSAGAAHAAVSTAPNVWLVEQTGDAELYSNGLRVERRYLTHSEPVHHRVFMRSIATPAHTQIMDAPAGIVFHASESDLAPFEPDHAEAVKRQAIGLLAWVQSKNLYHYVVDRIGRVYRILNDNERADHAGNSVWADSGRIYLNLNGSFLGVAFEARTGTKLEPAQVHAGRILVDMLRARYRIAPENCVTHAQVSVNPANFRVGYHTDWIANFPFRDLGLTDNYERPLASIALFGFSYDPGYIESAAPPLRESVLRSERQNEADAVGKDLPSQLYERSLRARYTQLRAAIMPAHQESYGSK